MKNGTANTHLIYKIDAVYTEYNNKIFLDN